MNLEVSVWTAYLSLELSGSTLIQLVGLVLVFGVAIEVVRACRAMVARG